VVGSQLRQRHALTGPELGALDRSDKLAAHRRDRLCLNDRLAANGRSLAGPWAEAAPEIRVIASNKAAWAAVLLMLIDVLPSAAGDDGFSEAAAIFLVARLYKMNLRAASI
jgi:hypothetical protein